MLPFGRGEKGQILHDDKNLAVVLFFFWFVYLFVVFFNPSIQRSKMLCSTFATNVKKKKTEKRKKKRDINALFHNLKGLGTKCSNRQQSFYPEINRRMSVGSQVDKVKVAQIGLSLVCTYIYLCNNDDDDDFSNNT